MLRGQCCADFLPVVYDLLFHGVPARVLADGIEREHNGRYLHQARTIIAAETEFLRTLYYPWSGLTSLIKSQLKTDIGYRLHPGKALKTDLFQNLAGCFRCPCGLR